MKGTDAIRKEFVLKKVVQYVHTERHDMLLQIGSDDGVLFDLVHQKVKECHCIEPAGRRARVLARRYRGLSNILIQQGSLTNLPYPHGYFTRIFFHEMSLRISSELELRRTLDEIYRVAAKNAVIFIGGISTKKEPSSRFLSQIRERIELQLTRWRESLPPQGWMATRIDSFLRSWRTLSYGFLISEKKFRSLCREYRLEGPPLRIELTHALSLARTDFLLRPVHGDGRSLLSELSQEKELIKDVKP